LNTNSSGKESSQFLFDIYKRASHCRWFEIVHDVYYNHGRHNYMWSSKFWTVKVQETTLQQRFATQTSINCENLIHVKNWKNITC